MRRFAAAFLYVWGLESYFMNFAPLQFLRKIFPNYFMSEKRPVGKRPVGETCLTPFKQPYGLEMYIAHGKLILSL